MKKEIRLLIVEDNPFDFTNIREYLQKDTSVHYQIQWAKTLKECIDELSTNQYNIVILDLGLPDSNRLDTINNVKKFFPNIAIIVLTALDDDELGLQSIHASVLDYVPKNDVYYRYLSRTIQFSLERKEKTQSVIESEEKFRSLFEHSADGKAITYPDGTFMINKAFLEMLGYTEDNPPKTWMEITHPDDIQLSNEYVQKMISGDLPKVNFEKRYLHKSGQIIWANVTSSAIKNEKGEIKFFITSVVDITQKKKQEQELIDSNERYRNLFMYSPDAIYVIFNEIVEFVNKACISLFKAKDESDLVNKSIFELYPPEEHPIIKQRIKQLNETKQILPVREGKIQAMDGSIVDVDVMAAPFWIKGEMHTHVIIRDISERKKKDAQLRTFNEQLELIVQQRTAELKDALDALESFSYSVSHDLRAPVRAIDGFSYLLFSDCYQYLDEKGKNYVQRIRNETKHISQLIDALITLSKIDRTEITLESINLTKLAYDVINRLMIDVKDREINWTIEDNLTTYGDPILIDIVLTNLFNNALKYTIHKDVAQITLGKMTKNQKDIFYVKDNGIGFDNNQIHKLFVAFQRLHSQKEYPGLGIGLATCKRIIMKHKGLIWAEGELEKGATFYFTIGLRNTLN